MIDFVKKITSEAGRRAKEASACLSSADLSFKNDKDLVTTVDRAIEDYLVLEIQAAYPEHDILGEESGETKRGGRFRWVIDPIDGTTSFVHGQPFYSVSVALQDNGATIAGAVCAPVLGELFWAERGRGAFCNGKPLRVSSRDRLINSVLSTGFACMRAGHEDNNLKYFAKILPSLRGIRRYGSAALDLSFVASGRLEGFWEMNLNLYDIAAGVLLVEEAGGRVCDFKGGTQFPANGTFATNGLIHDELLAFFT